MYVVYQRCGSEVTIMRVQRCLGRVYMDGYLGMPPWPILPVQALLPVQASLPLEIHPPPPLPHPPLRTRQDQSGPSGARNEAHVQVSRGRLAVMGLPAQ